MVSISKDKFYEKVHFIQYIIPLTGKQINLDKLHCGNLQMKYINTFYSALESKHFTERHWTFSVFLINTSAESRSGLLFGPRPCNARINQ